MKLLLFLLCFCFVEVRNETHNRARRSRSMYITITEQNTPQKEENGCPTEQSSDYRYTKNMQLQNSWKVLLLALPCSLVHQFLYVQADQGRSYQLFSKKKKSHPFILFAVSARPPEEALLPRYATRANTATPATGVLCDYRRIIAAVGFFSRTFGHCLLTAWVWGTEEGGRGWKRG